ncbi:MAG: thaumatin family protein [Gammaproteobacteria bacterium]
MKTSIAAKDPVGWEASPPTGFPAQTQVGNSYVVSYTLTNNVPAALPLTIGKSYAGNILAVEDTCNKTIPANGTCMIHVGLQPAQVGPHSAKVTIEYGHTRVSLPGLTTNAISAKTTEKIDGFVTQPLPPQVEIGTSYPVIFSFINDGNVSVTTTSVTASGFTPTLNTCAVTIPANSSCTVQGMFVPTVVGHATLGVTYRYNFGGIKAVTLLTTTHVYRGTGACSHVTGLTVFALPETTYLYSDNVVKFTFTNHCDALPANLGAVSLVAKLNGVAVNYLTKGSISGVNDTCSGATLAPNASCSVYASLIPTSPGSLSVEANLPYHQGTQIATAVSTERVSEIPAQTLRHTVTFVNQCNYTVWFEFLNGNGQPASSGVLSPDPLAGSPPDAYKIPGQVGSVPAVKTLAISKYENGKINARTGCNPTTMVCQTASCQTIPGTGTCVVGAGAGEPSTAFESYMTGVPATDGVYDLSLINGFNVPVEIKGLAPVSTSTTDPNAPYSCTAAGAIIQPATAFNPPLGACPWVFTPPNTAPDATANFAFVSAGADSACTTNASCVAPAICGMGWNSNINTGAGTPINRRCGTFQGYWTVADFIGYSSVTGDWGTVNLYNVYQINSSLATTYGTSTVNPGTATNYDLYGCVPTSNDSLDSGYKSGKSRVCGCYNWDQAGSFARTNVTQQCCTPTTCGNSTAIPPIVDAPNPLWQTTVFNRIRWLKKACPTAYSYQFDDKSSSFQCNQASKFTSYQIVFCPAGKTGAPV